MDAAVQISTFQIGIEVCFTGKDHESKKIDAFPSGVNMGQREAADAMDRRDDP